MQLKNKPTEHQPDEVSASRRALLKYALSAAVATSIVGKAMAETPSSTNQAKSFRLRIFQPQVKAKA